MNKIRFVLILSAAFLMCLMIGCAFDVSYVKKMPVDFTPTTNKIPGFVLDKKVTVHLGTGFPTRLENGTRWYQVGETEYGAVFETGDQIVTVEASDIYEARLIVSNQCITGFYLPVEKEVAPVSRPIHIQVEPINGP